MIVSLQSWWCPWCHAMNRDTWANPEVRAVLKDHFIPVYVDQDSRPDVSQRYERWGWPATIIFGPDGTEIVKLRGFYSPKFFIPVLPRRSRILRRSITASSAARSASARSPPASPTPSVPRSWASSTRPMTAPMAAGAKAS